MAENLLPCGHDRKYYYFHNGCSGSARHRCCKCDDPDKKTVAMQRLEPDPPKTTVVNCKRDDYDVYIGRGSIWGNPFKIGVHGDRLEVIAKHRDWIKTQPQLVAAAYKLKGKRLGCYCAPKICHGDTLKELAEGSMYSEKEREMFIELGFEDLLHHIEPPALYRLAVEDVFLKCKTGPAVESLRRTCVAFYQAKVYRMTPEFDAMIQLEIEKPAMDQQRIDRMDKKFCMKCEIELFVEGSIIYKGVSFNYNKAGYGSRFDDLCVGNRFFDKDPQTPLTRLEHALTGDVVEAFLCDDCFEKHADKLRIYKIETRSTCEEVK